MTRKSVAEISFFVPGRPTPGGSKRAFIVHHRGCPAGRRSNPGPCHCKPFTTITDQSGQRGADWRTAIRAKASEHLPFPVQWQYILLRIIFSMPRPKAMKDGPAVRHNKEPDQTKLVRAVEDALNGIAWLNDSLVCAQICAKFYAGSNQQPGAHITVCQLTEKPLLFGATENERI